jgi:hypothetical protein
MSASTFVLFMPSNRLEVIQGSLHLTVENDVSMRCVFHCSRLQHYLSHQLYWDLLLEEEFTVDGKPSERTPD